jgi:hypothetical protein
MNAGLGAQPRVEAKQGSVVITGNATNVRIEMSNRELRQMARAVGSQTQQNEAQQRRIAALERALGARTENLRLFFRLLGEENVPEDQMGVRLIQISERYRSLEAQLQAVPASNSETRPAVERALSQGNFVEADSLLRARQYWRGIAQHVTFRRSPGQIFFPDGWDVSHVTTISIPQLRGISDVEGHPITGEIRFFQPAHEQLRRAFEEVEEAHLLGAIKMWCKSFATSVRPTPTSFALITEEEMPAPHPLGLAFDINCREPEGTQRSATVRAFAEIMARHGFVWGPGPFHFQYAGPVATSGPPNSSAPRGQ